MKINYLAISLFILMLGLSSYINYQIAHFNLNYYNGKDDGLIVQLESIIFFGVLYFFLISKTNRLLSALLGLLVAIISCVVAYLFLFGSLYFNILASVLVLLVFELKKKIRKR